MNNKIKFTRKKINKNVLLDITTSKIAQDLGKNIYDQLPEIIKLLNIKYYTKKSKIKENKYEQN